MEFQSKSFQSLLQIANDNTISGAGKEYWEESGDDPPKTLFKNPATAQEIATLEDRLGIALPNDYKEFLAISNGFGSGHLEDGIYNGYYPEPELFSVDKVNWNSEPYFQLPIDLLELPYEIIGLASSFPDFDRVLEIGVRDVENTWLVRPELVERARVAYMEMYEKADDQQKKIIERAIEEFVGSKEAFEKLEWCCVRWSAGGAAAMRGHAGFRRYVEHVVKQGTEDRGKP
ncbi:hypothetical protein NA57DRAFT_54295 [Rhizodiscina lignyota]|uniref:Knr4/Smi1-like domain-containing protein n=1 Tax=Rhizodiscina lignyota TaxID=1504668 RepID=A0A9P4M702_9PEZI|nr:hypothetical protein NA57DRAFT_54295 [Rhizodiscina lignyota]